MVSSTMVKDSACAGEEKLLQSGGSRCLCWCIAGHWVLCIGWILHRCGWFAAVLCFWCDGSCFCAVASGSWALVTVLASCVVFASLVCFFVVLVVVGLLVDDLLLGVWLPLVKC